MEYDRGHNIPKDHLLLQQNNFHAIITIEKLSAVGYTSVSLISYSKVTNATV